MFFWRKRKSSGWNLIIGDGGKAGLDPDLLQLSSEEKKQLMYDAVYLPMCMCVGVCCFLPQQAPWTIDAAAEGLIQLVVIVDNPHVFSLEVGLCSTMFNFNYYSTIEYSDVRINIDVQNPHQLVNVTTHTSADFGWSRCHLEIKGLRKYQSISLCFFCRRCVDMLCKHHVWSDTEVLIGCFSGGLKQQTRTWKLFCNCIKPFSQFLF